MAEAWLFTDSVFSLGDGLCRKLLKPGDLDFAVDLYNYPRKQPLTLNRSWLLSLNTNSSPNNVIRACDEKQNDCTTVTPSNSI